MTQKNIFIGTSADDGTGDILRDAFANVNTNFNELFANQALHNESSNNWANNISFYWANIAESNSKLYADGLSYGNVSASLKNQINLSFNTANGAFDLANNIVSGAVVISNTSIANANSITIKYGNVAADPRRLDATAIKFWTRKGPTPNVMFVQQSDDDFVFYTTNTNYSIRPVWSVFANTCNSSLRIQTPLMLENGIKLRRFDTAFGTESFGNTGDIIVSYGGENDDYGSVYWQAPETVSVRIFNAKGDGITDDTFAIQRAINNVSTSTSGSKAIYFPKGTYIITSPLDLKGKRIRLVGAGLTETIIKSNTNMNSIIDVNETSANVLYTLSNPFFVENMRLQGNNNKANNGIVVSYRSNYEIKNVQIDECANGIVYAGTTLGLHENVKIHDCKRVGIYLGDDNIITPANIECSLINFKGCSISGNTSLGVGLNRASKIRFESSEILNLANTKGLTPSLSFNGLPTPNGTCVMVGGTPGCDITFDACSLGLNCQGPIIFVTDGLITIKNTWLNFGFTPTSYVMRSQYGTVNVENSWIVGQNFVNVDMIAYKEIDSFATGPGGKIRFIGCRSYAPGLGNYVCKGDILNFGPMGRVFAPRLGKSYSTVSSNVTSFVTTNGLSGGNAKRFTILSSSDANSYLGASAQLTGISDIRSNENMTLIVVYQSTTNVAVRLTSAAANGSPVSQIGVMPNTDSQMKTYIKLDVQYPIDNRLYTHLEFHSSPPAQNSAFLQIEEVYFTDNHVTNSGQTGYGISGPAGAGSDWANLHKC